MRILALAALLLASPLCVAEAEAQAPQLSLPVACVPGETCFVQNYVDADRADKAYADFACGRLTYDGHDGTDFRMPPPPAPAVDVVAAADGVVFATRDGEADRSFRAEFKPDLDRALGNAVVLRHEGGLTTTYGHMAEGSIRVSKGDKVLRGQPLGKIGASGMTEFHHVHFGVRLAAGDEGWRDPFTGREVGAGCGAAGAAMWTAEAAAALADASRTNVVAVGFNDAPVTTAMVEDGAVTAEVGTDAGAFVAWGLALGTEPGDEVFISLTGPDADLHDHAVEERSRAQILRFVGRRRPPQPGTYTVRFEVKRAGATIAAREATMTAR